MCTLKNYPYKIEHTIQWSRDSFEGLFTQSIQTLSQFRDNADYLENLRATPELHDEAVRSLHKLLIATPCTSFEDCIRWGLDLFYTYFNHEIRQLLHQFPVLLRSAVSRIEGLH